MKLNVILLTRFLCGSQVEKSSKVIEVWKERYIILLMTFAITFQLHYLYLVWGEVEVVAFHFSGLDNAILVMGVTVR